MTTSRDHEPMHELISRRLDNDLSTVELRILDEHLRTCLPCRRLARDMEVTVLQFRAAAPKNLAKARRLEIAKELERGGYMEVHPSLGHRIAQYGATLARAPKRFAWAISSILVIAGGGLALYSALAPQRNGERSRRAIPTTNVQVAVRTVAQKTKAQGTLEDGGTIWTGDQIFLKVFVQPSPSGAASGPNEQAIYLSAKLVAGDGSSRLLSEQQRVFPSQEIGPFLIAGGSGEGRLVWVVTREPEKVQFSGGGCSDAPKGSGCRILRFEQKFLPPLQPNQQEMR